jgi:predicted phosphodiesterase
MIYTIGDIHGNPNLISSSNWKESKNLTKDDIVIFLGDFGLYWDEPASKDENYWLNWLAAKPFTVAFIDGNHENFNLINNLPQEEKWGGKVGVDHRFNGDIYHLKRGEIYNIQGKEILTLGGALSIDKHLRSEGFSWWPEELWSRTEEENCLDNLDKVNWKVDYVLAHTCPDSCIYYVIDGMSEKFRDPTARFFEFVANKLEFNEWRFGHFHCDREFTDQSGDKYICQYKTIKEL